MEKNLHKKYIPTCPRNIGIVDQYSWANKDTNDYMCNNGISHPIYDCNGDIQFSLPLEMYPPVNRIHPQIKMVKRSHLNWRDSERNLNSLMKEELVKYRSKEQNIIKENRLEGFYDDTEDYSREPRLNFVTNYDGYPLPNPYTVQNSACRGLY